ncbi:MAG: hypothetical protein NE328_10180 [Lentisphaeraceae bacterium]|nr:hypothetical protein [Lentisphaeraceae bacterium]
MKHLRQTPTNASNDSKGHSLGLEGDQFLYIIAGVVAGIIILLVSMNSGISPGTSLIIAAIPIPLCIVFLFVFKIGKPPRYSADLFQKWFGNKSLKKGHSLLSPYKEISQGSKTNEA